jgi:UDP-3-O-[3-hydroxymyristoyl] glucosamine N-acyltransferase
MPTVPISEIVQFVEGRYTGPADRVISGAGTLADAGPEQVTFLANPKYAALVASTGAGAVLVGNDFEGTDDRWIRVADPYFAMARVVARWFAARPQPIGISPHASIAASATIAANAGIGPFVTIADGVTIGENSVIYQGVSIEAGATIGRDCIIYPNVAIYDGTRIGDRCIVHANAVIGSDGYGFATHGGRHHKIPQIGIVRIENDVEIGAGTTIDRAALGETVIGEGTKIDNLVQIGHNVRVGKHCFLVSQVGIAGSTELGDYVAVAGQSGFAGHLKIGNRVQVAAKSAVLEDVADGVKVMGIPAVPFREFARREATLRRMTKKRQ